MLDPLTAMVHRILRENGVSHPLIEARKTIKAEQQQICCELARAWRICQQSQSGEAWQEARRTFRYLDPGGGASDLCRLEASLLSVPPRTRLWCEPAVVHATNATLMKPECRAELE